MGLLYTAYPVYGITSTDGSAYFSLYTADGSAYLSIDRALHIVDTIARSKVVCVGSMGFRERTGIALDDRTTAILSRYKLVDINCSGRITVTDKGRACVNLLPLLYNAGKPESAWQFITGGIDGVEP